MQWITNTSAKDNGRLSYELSFFGGFQPKTPLPPSCFSCVANPCAWRLARKLFLKLQRKLLAVEIKEILSIGLQNHVANL
jgi:hypothetical protein